MGISIDIIQAVCGADSPDYLKASIESMLGQTRQFGRYFLVVDGSIPRILKEVLGQYGDHLTTLNNAGRRGLAGSLNTAIAASKSELLVRMDSDDISEPERVERMAELFENDPNLLVLGTGAREIDWTGRLFFVKTMPSTVEGVLKMAATRPPFIHVSTGFRRDFFNQVGMYDDKYAKAQDYDLWARTIIHYPHLLNRMKNIEEPLITVRLPKNFWAKRSFTNIRYGTRISLRLIRHQKRYHMLLPLLAKVLLRLSPAMVKKAAYRSLR